MELFYSYGPYRFHNGAFVIHGITSRHFKGKVSAWFMADGTLQDAEQRPHLGQYRTVPIRKNGPIWQALAILGHCHATCDKVAS